MLPLESIKVLDLMVGSGYCGMELADHGATVIKVEPPATGDPLRTMEPMKNGVSVHHAFRDRGKQSVTLDLNNAEGREIFKKLVAGADVVLENFAPGTMEAWGLGYEDLKKIRPALVYGRISACGSEGPGREVPQSDLVAQAKCGVMHFTGFPEAPPTRIGFAVSEHYAASFLASAVCFAIYRAMLDGEGQLVETTLCGSAVAISEDKIITYGAEQCDPMRTGNAHPLINPYDILKCKNGYVAMGISSDAQWAKFCATFNCMEWTEDEKYCSNLVRGYHYFGDLRVKLEELFSEYTMEEIAAKCDQALIPGTMCSTTKEALQQPQLQVRNMIVEGQEPSIGSLEMPGRPVKFAGQTETPLQPAPALGADNRAVYTAAGVDAETLSRLEREGII